MHLNSDQDRLCPGHKISLSKLKRTEAIQYMLLNYDGIKLEIQKALIMKMNR